MNQQNDRYIGTGLGTGVLVSHMNRVMRLAVAVKLIDGDGPHARRQWPWIGLLRPVNMRNDQKHQVESSAGAKQRPLEPAVFEDHIHGMWTHAQEDGAWFQKARVDMATPKFRGVLNPWP